MNKYISVDEIFHVIGHNASAFFRITLQTLLFLLVLYVLFIIFHRYIVWEYTSRAFGLVGVAFFVKYIIDFLNLYLDCLILSSGGITLFMREGLFDHKTDFFGRNTIETVSHTQNTFRDKIFARGNLLIKLDRDIEYPFENINRPRKQVERILRYKEKYGPNKSTDKDI